MDFMRLFGIWGSLAMGAGDNKIKYAFLTSLWCSIQTPCECISRGRWGWLAGTQPKRRCTSELRQDVSMNCGGGSLGGQRPL